jgi:hypothetical protein
MGWAGHVEHIRTMKNVQRISVGKPDGSDYTDDLSVDESIILNWILGK